MRRLFRGPRLCVSCGRATRRDRGDLCVECLVDLVASRVEEERRCDFGRPCQTRTTRQLRTVRCECARLDAVDGSPIYGNERP
jgi:NMD protein affecting ribosome stability and mRNA decay